MSTEEHIEAAASLIIIFSLIFFAMGG